MNARFLRAALTDALPGRGAPRAARAPGARCPPPAREAKHAPPPLQPCATVRATASPPLHPLHGSGAQGLGPKLFIKRQAALTDVRAPIASGPPPHREAAIPTFPSAAVSNAACDCSPSRVTHCTAPNTAAVRHGERRTLITCRCAHVGAGAGCPVPAAAPRGRSGDASRGAGGGRRRILRLLRSASRAGASCKLPAASPQGCSIPLPRCTRVQLGVRLLPRRFTLCTVAAHIRRALERRNGDWAVGDQAILRGALSTDAVPRRRQLLLRVLLRRRDHQLGARRTPAGI